MDSEKPFLRPAIPGDMRDAAARASLIARAAAERMEIAQYFRDVAYWNEQVRKPHEEPIDPDPNGVMASCLAYLNQFFPEEGRVDD